MNEETANKIYDVLVQLGGAYEKNREMFLHAHLKGDIREYRFQGVFGFGGKYRVKTNRIDYYSEDHTKPLDLLREHINEELNKIEV